MGDVLPQFEGNSVRHDRLLTYLLKKHYASGNKTFTIRVDQQKLEHFQRLRSAVPPKDIFDELRGEFPFAWKICLFVRIGHC